MKAELPERIVPSALAAAVTEPYHNRSLASVNDHEVRISVMTSDFPWHSHPTSDETFIGVEGKLIVEFRDSAVTLEPGDLVTVPAGVVHRTRPEGARSVNLTFERVAAQTLFHDE